MLMLRRHEAAASAARYAMPASHAAMMPPWQRYHYADIDADADADAAATLRHFRMA